MDKEYHLRIKVSDIPKEGKELEVNDAMPPELVGLSKEDYIHFISPLQINAKLNRIENAVLSRIHVKGRYESFCARSLERIEQEWESDFTFDVPVENNMEEVDLGDDIRQEVILNVPLKLLSEEEQKKESAEVSGEKNEPQDGKMYKPFKNLKIEE